MESGEKKEKVMENNDQGKFYIVIGKDKIEKICNILMHKSELIIKSFVKWFSYKYDICIPEFLNIKKHAKTRFFRTENNDLDCITFCSVDKLAIILEYTIPEKETEKNIIGITANFNIVYASKKPCFSGMGTFPFEILFGTVTVKN